VLTPPLAALPNLKPISWPHDAMPDFLWIQAIHHETRELALANDALDVLDDFVPTEAGFLDGRISSLAIVPPDRREAACKAFRGQVPWAVPRPFAQAIRLYPECPGLWLFDDPAVPEAPEAGPAYLKRLVEPIIASRDRPSSKLRLIPIARMLSTGSSSSVRA
jgi:hypothetical protein